MDYDTLYKQLMNDIKKPTSKKEVVVPPTEVKKTPEVGSEVPEPVKGAEADKKDDKAD